MLRTSAPDASETTFASFVTKSRLGRLTLATFVLSVVLGGANAVAIRFSVVSWCSQGYGSARWCSQRA